MPHRLNGVLPKKPSHGSLQSAYWVTKYSHDTACSLLKTFDLVRKERGGGVVPPGKPTDEEHDLLRAMLLFTCSGLDSMLKHLISDALLGAINNDENVLGKFKKRAATRIMKAGSVDANKIVELLMSDEVIKKMLDDDIADLTGSSLQSVNELMKAASYFELDDSFLKSRKEQLRDVFEARNQITHELDIDFEQPSSNRRARSRDVMADHSKLVFEVAGEFISKVETKFFT